MITRDIFADVREMADLAEIARAYTDLRLNSSREWHGPCPLCREGHDRFMVLKKDPTRWYCRRCQKTGDATDLVAQCEGVPLLEAARRILGREQLTTTRPITTPRATPKAAPEEWTTTEWQTRALELIAAAQLAFDGSSSEKYLLGRGITRATCDWFGIGHGKHPKTGREGVLIPIMDRVGVPRAIKYRHLEGDRFSQVKGSSPGVFGLELLQNAPERPLIVVEGELNAISIWQAAGDILDVVSVGSQSSRASLELIAAWIKTSPRSKIVLWFDTPDAALAAREIIPKGVPRQSPYDKDANDILRDYGDGGLREFLSSIIGVGKDTPPPSDSPPTANVEDESLSPKVDMVTLGYGQVDTPGEPVDFEAQWGPPLDPSVFKTVGDYVDRAGRHYRAVMKPRAQKWVLIQSKGARIPVPISLASACDVLRVPPP